MENHDVEEGKLLMKYCPHFMGCGEQASYTISHNIKKDLRPQNRYI